MEQSKKGGKRNGAGRKPVDNPKEQVTLYVPKKSIWLFGNKDKLKTALYDFIDTKHEDEPKAEIRDLTQPTREIKAYEQPKTNFSVNTVPPTQPLVLTPMEAYKQEIKATTWSGDLEKVMKRIKADILPNWQKKQLEEFAREHAKEFTN